MRKPATIAVKSPRSGGSPEAIAKAIASGKATIPTVIPAPTSAKKVRRSYPSRKQITDFGSKRCIGLDSPSYFLICHSITRDSFNSALFTEIGGMKIGGSHEGH